MAAKGHAKKKHKKCLIKGNMDQNFIVEFKKQKRFFYSCKQRQVKIGKYFCGLCQKHIRTVSSAQNKWLK